MISILVVKFNTTFYLKSLFLTRELTSNDSSLLHPKGEDRLGAVEMEHYGKDFCP